MLSSFRWWFARRPHLALELTERLIRLSFYNATGEEEEGTELDENGVAIPKKKIESVTQHATAAVRPFCIQSWNVGVLRRFEKDSANAPPPPPPAPPQRPRPHWNVRPPRIQPHDRSVQLVRLLIVWTGAEAARPAALGWLEQAAQPQGARWLS